MAALGLRCCVWAFSKLWPAGATPQLRCAAFSEVVSPVAHRPQARRLIVLARGLHSCDIQTQLPLGMWDLPRPQIERMSPALAGGFFITEPPGKPTSPPLWLPLWVCSQTLYHPEFTLLLRAVSSVPFSISSSITHVSPGTNCVQSFPPVSVRRGDPERRPLPGRPPSLRASAHSIQPTGSLLGPLSRAVGWSPALPSGSQDSPLEARLPPTSLPHWG